MKGTKRVKFSYIQSLLCSTASIAMLSVIAQPSHARSLFAESTAVPTIEINLDAIRAAQKAREIAANEAALQARIEAAKQAEEVKVNNIDQAVEESDVVELSDEEDAQEEMLEDAASNASGERLPIIIKKTEAPVSPLYQKDKLVAAPEGFDEKKAAEEEKSQRTVASMFRDLFYGDEEVGEIKEEPASNAVVEQEEPPITAPSVAKIDPESVIVKRDEPNELQASSEQAEIRKPVDEERQLSLWLDDEDVAPTVNTVELKDEVPASEEKEEASFFDRMMENFKSSDREAKKEAIIIKKPELAQDAQAPSILNDSDADFNLLNDGKELLKDGTEESLVASDEQQEIRVEEQEIADLPEALPENNPVVADDDALVILPNEIKPDADIFVPAPTVRPQLFAASKEVEEEVKEIEIAEAPDVQVPIDIASNSATEEEIVSDIQNDIAQEAEEQLAAQQEEVEKISSLAEKELPKPTDHFSITTQEVPVAAQDEPIDDEVTIKIMPQEPTQATIPAPAEIITNDLPQKELVATPVTIEEKQETKSLLSKAKNWFGIKEEAKKEVEQTAAIVTQSQADDNDLPPPLLPEPVDVASLEEKIDSLNIAVKAKTEEQQQAAEEILEKATIVDEKASDVEVILPNKIEEVVSTPEAEMVVAALDSTALDAPKAAVQAETKELPPFVHQGGVLTLNFSPAANVISDAAKQEIASLSNEVKANNRKRIQIKSYASSVEDRKGTARRISLQRAIAIRSIFVQNGVDGVRINVQAMGIPEDQENQDRADISVIED